MYKCASWLVIIYICLITVAARRHLLPNKDILYCWRKTRTSPPNIANPSDCDAAIRMIPSGRLETSYARYNNPVKPISLEMEIDAGRKLRLPAAFLAGSCVITVRAMSNSLISLPPKQAATAMYFEVWPNARAVASTIIQSCMLQNMQHPHFENASGAMETTSKLEGVAFQYEVRVRGAPRTIPERGVNKLDAMDGYNIYISDKVPWIDKLREKRLREEAANLASSTGFINAIPLGVRRSRRPTSNRYRDA